MRPYSLRNVALIYLVALYWCSGTMVQRATGAPASAPGETSRIGYNWLGSGVDSPQLLYMRTLHDRIKGTKVKSGSQEIKDENTAGTLIATSFEVTGGVTGAGWNSSGFSLESGNQLLLNFDLPNPGDSIGIHETDLWLFPKPSQLQNNGIMDLTLLVVVELSHATKPRREVMNYSWKMDRGCLRLNMTGLSRKIINNLQKRGLEKTNVSVSIEVVAAREPEVIQESSIVLDKDLQEGCSALQSRSSNEPFLVMKYYNEEQLAHLSSLSVEEDVGEESTSLPSSHVQQKRQSESDQLKATVTPPSVSTTTEPSSVGCSLVPLMVNLTRAFGDFIIEPIMLNIQDCYGSCSSGYDSDQFTLHAKIKEQVEMTEGAEAMKRSSACCSPSSYEQKDLLIRKDNYIALVSFPDMVVAGCHCS